MPQGEHISLIPIQKPPRGLQDVALAQAGTELREAVCCLLHPGDLPRTSGTLLSLYWGIGGEVAVVGCFLGL